MSARTVHFDLDLSVEEGADLDAIADDLLDLLCATEASELPESVLSFDGCEVDRSRLEPER